MSNDDNEVVILIVDDTMTNLLLLGKMLEKAGYAVKKAQSGKECRKVAKEIIPSLILLDVMMPDEDGFQTIEKLKADPETCNIPVIFVTALTDIESKVKGFDLGAVDFITKPFHPAEVKARVKLQLKLSVSTSALLALQKEKLKQVEDAQLSLLVTPKELPEAKFACYYVPLEEAGGDFYDVIKISDNIHSYFLADVSGHDISTSFITSAVKALLSQNCRSMYESVESMRMLNEVLLDFLPQNKYLTANYLKVDRRNYTASYVQMAHPPLIHLSASTGEAKAITGSGDILGMFNKPMYTENSFEVEKGDRLFLYSDGLIEDTKVWSANVEELVKATTRTSGMPLEDVPFALTSMMFSSGRKPDDDIVVLVVEV